MKLKHYNTYYNKILDYCKIINVDVYFQTGLNNAMFITKGRKIYIDPEFTESDKIAVLLHELGHFLDDTINNKKFDKLYERASKKMDKNISLNFNEFNCIMTCELNAWKLGIVIAKKLKIPLGLWYKKTSEKYLASYFEVKTHKNVIK